MCEGDCVVPAKFFEPITARDWSLQTPFSNPVLPITMGTPLAQPQNSGPPSFALGVWSSQCASDPYRGISAPYFTKTSQFMDPYSVFYQYSKR